MLCNSQEPRCRCRLPLQTNYLYSNRLVQVILFGAACWTVTDQIVKAARHWNLVEVRHAGFPLVAQYSPLIFRKQYELQYSAALKAGQVC